MKKNLPLQVLQTLEPFIKKESPLFELTKSDESLLYFKDKDKNSDFYFSIEEHKIEGTFKLLVDWKPHNNQSTVNYRTWINGDVLELYFDQWVTMLNGYEKVKSIFDDPILEAFANEYYTEFENVDVDAETNPFNTKQILLLDERLEYIETEIVKYETEENKKEIQEIVIEVKSLRESLTKKSKKWVVKHLSQICGKIAKQGPKLIKEFLSEVKKEGIKEVVKEGIKLLIEHGTDIVK